MNPPERGGLGMSPEAAKQLTIDEAEFYLSEEKDVRKGDKAIRDRLGRRGAKPKPLTVAEQWKKIEEWQAARRRYYEGG